MDLLSGSVILFALVCCYLLPTIIADKRAHPSGLAIMVLNLFFGWSIIGWFAALIWSLTATGSRHHVA